MKQNLLQNITITKLERKDKDKNLNIIINFKEFNDLFLKTLENKKKIKPHKRGENFDYENFHKKERERLSRVKNISDVIIMPSPPKKKNTRLSTSSKTSKTSKTSITSKPINESEKSIKKMSDNLIFKASGDIYPPSIQSHFSSPVKNDIEYEQFINVTEKNSINSKINKINHNFDINVLNKYNNEKSPNVSLSSISSLEKKTPIISSSSKLIKSPIIYSSPKIIKSPSIIRSEIQTVKSSITTSSFRSLNKEKLPDTTENIDYSIQDREPILQWLSKSSEVSNQSYQKSLSKINHEKLSTVSPSNPIVIKSPRNKISSIYSCKTISNSEKKLSVQHDIESFKSEDMITTNNSSNVQDDNITKNKIQSLKGKVLKPCNSFRSDEFVTPVKSKRIVSIDSLCEEDEKRQILFKFQLLANKYPQFVLKYPFNMRSDLKVMKNTYKMILKQIQVNNKVDNLNLYLLLGFMLCEQGLGKLGFDMEGFSKEQIANKKSYESLLLELGEKETSFYGDEKWCVEARLCRTLFFNALCFTIAKSMSKKSNFNFFSLLSSSKNDNKSVQDTKILNNDGDNPKTMKGFNNNRYTSST